MLLHIIHNLKGIQGVNVEKSLYTKQYLLHRERRLVAPSAALPLTLTRFRQAPLI